MNSICVQKNQEGKYVLSFETKPKPIAKRGEALVKVAFAGLNRRDFWISKGMYPGIQHGVTLGSDACGTVEAVGSPEDKAWIGKDVIINPNRNWGEDPKVQSADYHILGMPEDGCLAEYCLCPIDRLHDRPMHLSQEEASVLPLAGLTAYRALMVKGACAPGQKVLISGVGGGVAHLAFFMALAQQAEVYVSSGTESKRKLALERGALKAYNYKSEGWIKEAKKDTQSGFDLIIDSGGGKGFNDLLRVLAPGGRLVFYGATEGLPPGIDLFKLFWLQGSILGSTMGNDDEFQAMLNFVSQHKIQPYAAKVHPFKKGIEAIASMEHSSYFGKVCIAIASR